MAGEIRGRIVERLSSGEDLQSAYRHASDEATSKILIGVSRGLDLHDAVARAGIENARDVVGALRSTDMPDPKLMYMIVSGGGVADVPDASCIARELAGKPHPTRKDIEAAFEACRAPR